MHALPSLVDLSIRQPDTGMQPQRTASYLRQTQIRKKIPLQENQRKRIQVVCWWEPVCLQKRMQIRPRQPLPSIWKWAHGEVRRIPLIKLTRVQLPWTSAIQSTLMNWLALPDLMMPETAMQWFPLQYMTAVKKQLWLIRTVQRQIHTRVR